MKTVTITGANTFAEISDSGWNSDTLTIVFPNATTNVAKWTVFGSATYPVTLQRTGSGGTFTLNYSGTSNISVDYVNVSNGNGLPASTWYMGANSIDGGGNTGFIFAYGAVRYWVGGTGTWDGTSTTNWAYQSGYAGGAPAPTSSDDVYFDSNSSSGSFTVTIDSNFVGTGSISGNTLTITAVTSGTIAVGQRIYTSFIDFQSGSMQSAIITSFGTGTGGVGTYALSDSVSTSSSRTIWSGVACSRNMSIVGPATGSLMLTGSRPLVICGSVYLPATGFTSTYSGELCFYSNWANTEISTNNIRLTSALTGFAGGGTYQLRTAFTAANCRISNATIYFNDFNVTAINMFFHANSGGSRYVYAGSSLITITDQGISNLGDLSNASIVATGSYFNGPQNAVIKNLSLAHPSLSNIYLYGASLTVTGDFTITPKNSSSYYCGNLGGNGISDGIETITVNGTFTCLQPAGRAYSSFGVNLVLNGPVTVSNINFFRTNVTGTSAPLTGTLLGDLGDNSGIVFDTPKTVYWNLSGTQNWNANGWALTSGGTPSVDNFPLPQDTAVFDDTGAAGTVNINAPYAILGTIDFSQRTTPVTLAGGSNTPTFYGNITLSSAVTLSGTGTWTFAGYGTRNITSSGKTFTMPINVNMESGGVFRLQDAFVNNNSATYSFTLTRGTLDLNNNTLTLARGLTALESSTNVRGINFGTGLIYLRDFWAIGDNFTATDSGGGVYFIASGSVSNYGSTKPNDYFTHPINVTVGPGNFSFTLQWNPTIVKNLTFVDGYTGTVSFRAARITGNLRLSAGMSVLDADSYKAVVFQGTNQTVITNGVVFRCPVYFGAAVISGAVPAGITPNITLLDNLTVNIGDQAATGFFPHSILIEKGTLNLNGKKITLLSNTQPNGIVSFGTNTRSLVFNGGSIETVTSGSTAWSFSGSNITVSGPGTINMTSSSAKTFAGGSINYSGVILNQGGSGDLTITGSNTFKAISNTSRPGAIILASSTTTTVNRLLLNGSELQQTSLRSSIANTRANLNILDDNISSYNLTVKDISATGKSLRVPANYGNINDGNNLNCNFTDVNKILDDNFSLFGNLIVV